MFFAISNGIKDDAGDQRIYGHESRFFGKD